MMRAREGAALMVMDRNCQSAQSVVQKTVSAGARACRSPNSDQILRRDGRPLVSAVVLGW
ncbi:MAG: hypothetical protein ABSH41_06625 [Syntrophobacteraceae bacterium]